MKLKLHNDKELDIDFWSFVKCNILANIVISLLFYGIFVGLGLIFVIIFN